MRIREVFSVIYEYEDNLYLRERKFQVIRAILEERLVDKTDFRAVIDKHEDLVKMVEALTPFTEPEVEESLIDIYNYPPIRAEYEDVVQPYIYEIIDNDDTSDDDEEDSDYEEDDTDDDEDYTKTVDAPMDTDFRHMNIKLTMTLIFSSVTFMLSVVNTLGIFAKR